MNVFVKIHLSPMFSGKFNFRRKSICLHLPHIMSMTENWNVRYFNVEFGWFRFYVTFNRFFRIFFQLWLLFASKSFRFLCWRFAGNSKQCVWSAIKCSWFDICCSRMMKFSFSARKKKRSFSITKEVDLARIWEIHWILSNFHRKWIR